jgi:hypothetical protein
MNETPRPPGLPIRSIVVTWDPEGEDTTVLVDRGTLSIFDAVGLLQIALDIAESEIPCVNYTEVED